MEIIKRGKLPSEDWVKGACNTCQTQAKFQKREGVCVSTPTSPRAIWKIECPVCRSPLYGSVESYNKWLSNKNVDPL